MQPPIRISLEKKEAPTPMAFFLFAFLQLAVEHQTAENSGWHWPGLTSQAWQHVLDELHAEMWPDTTCNQEKNSPRNCL